MIPKKLCVNETTLSTNSRNIVDNVVNAYDENFAMKFLPVFSCLGEDSWSKELKFSDNGFIKNNFVHYDVMANAAIKAVTSKSYNLYDGLSYFNELASIVNKQSALVILAPINANKTCCSVSNYQRRRVITDSLYCVLKSSASMYWDKYHIDIENLRQLLNDFLTEARMKTIFGAHSERGNNCTTAAYHLLHGALEWRLLDLCILHQLCATNDKSANDKSTAAVLQFNQQLKRIFDELLFCSLQVFLKKNDYDLLNASAFSCTCFKEIWLLLQQFMLRWSLTTKLKDNPSSNEEPLSFNIVYNKAMQRLFKRIGALNLNAAAFYHFGNFMNYNFVKLHCYNACGVYKSGSDYVAKYAENHEFCAQNTQKFLNAKPNELQLRAYICILARVLLEYYRPKLINTIGILWEHFNKHLNDNFIIEKAKLTGLAVIPESGQDYIEYCSKMLGGEFKMNLNSISLFIMLLGKILKSLREIDVTESKNQIVRFTGRIFSKFSSQKLLALNDIGIHHINQLFIVLCLTCDVKELMSNLQNILVKLEFKKLKDGSKKILVSKGHTALLIICAMHSLEMKAYIAVLLEQLRNVNYDFNLCKLFANSLINIFPHANCKQDYLLIDEWLRVALINSPPPIQDRIMESLHECIKKYKDENVQLLAPLKTLVLPFVLRNFGNNFSFHLIKLATDFCVMTNNRNDLRVLLNKLMHTNVHKNYEAQLKLLLKLLSIRNTAVNIDETLIMQVWLKGLTMLPPKMQLNRDLTEYVVKMDEFNSVCKLQLQNFENVASELDHPLLIFFRDVNEQYRIAPVSNRHMFADKLNNYLQYFTIWISDDQLKVENEISVRFYKFIFMAIENCARQLYIKSNPQCFFHVAMSIYILPDDLMRGVTPGPRFLHCLIKYWSSILIGIGTLNYKSDGYIKNLLHNFITNLIPKSKFNEEDYRILARPYIKFFSCGNEEFIEHVFELIGKAYLTADSPQMYPYARISLGIYQALVLTYIRMSNIYVNQNTRILACLTPFLRGILPYLLEHIMMTGGMVPTFPEALSLCETLFTSNLFQQSEGLKEAFRDKMTQFTKKYLSYKTESYFKMIRLLLTSCDNIVPLVMPIILEEINVVKESRVVEIYAHIRSCLEDLENMLARTDNN